MTIFDRIANLRGRIIKTQDKLKLIEMKAGSPRSSVFSDMPKGVFNVSNPLEQYMIDKEETAEKLKALESDFSKLWTKALCQMDDAGIDEQVKYMMYLRFHCGLQWKKCAATLNAAYPENKWSENKCFRKYREVLYRVRQEKKEAVRQIVHNTQK